MYGTWERGLSEAALQPPWQAAQGCWSTEQLYLQPSMHPGFPLSKQEREVPAA